MTAVIQKSKVAVHFPLPINSVAEGAAFLVMEECAKGVLIRRSSRYGRKLNPFWQVWLRELLRKADAKYGLHVKIRTHDVRVTSPLPVEDWVWAVWSLAANVVRVGSPPMWALSRRGQFDAQRWKVHEKADLRELVRSIELPKGAARFFTVSGGINGIYLNRYGRSSRRCVFPIHEVRLMVECQIALACNENGVPLRQPVTGPRTLRDLVRYRASREYQLERLDLHELDDEFWLPPTVQPEHGMQINQNYL